MKKLSIVLMGLIVICGCSSVRTKGSSMENIKTLAVLEFLDDRISSERDRYPNPSKIVQEKIINVLVNQNSFRIMERAQLEKILAEQKLQLSGLVDSASAVEIGKVLGVDGIMIGSITEYGRTIYPKVRLTLNVRVIEVKTGEIKWASEIRGRKTNFLYPVELLKDVIDDTVKQLAKRL